jgi:hypothetical protein
VSSLRTELLSGSEPYSESDLHVDTCGLRADHGEPDSRALSESFEELFLFSLVAERQVQQSPPA